jgi:hypothetical protein
MKEARVGLDQVDPPIPHRLGHESYSFVGIESDGMSTKLSVVRS